MTGTSVATPAGARRSRLGRQSASGLAETEYQRFLDQLRDLEPAEWSRPTDCPPWDVRTMATHVLGMAEMVTTVRSLLSQNMAAARRRESGVDALTAHQVERGRDLDPAQVVDRFAQVLPRAVSGRSRLAGSMGPVRMPKQQVDGRAEWWTFGFLLRTILTRDTWMHRMDIAAATGRQPALTAGHDGALVADVVDEWASRHGGPFRLQLTGPAGGSWMVGSGAEEIELDAVEFMRTLSGRAHGAGLLAVQVPF